MRAFLALRDATLAELPKSPARGDIALETADTRGGGGMDALGVFTVRVDEREGCVYGRFGTERYGLVWPFGYYAEHGDPVRILDEDGALVARVGDTLESGGGGLDGSGPPVCGTTSVWVMNGRPEVVADPTRPPGVGQ